VSAGFTGAQRGRLEGPELTRWTSAGGDHTSTPGVNATGANPNGTKQRHFTCAAQLPIYRVQQLDNRPL
jgi:hypothetical protein